MNPNRPWKLLPYLIGAALAVFLGWFVLTRQVGQPQIVNPSYNLLFLARPVIKPTEAVMVLMDEDSHRVLGQPYNTSWDRALHARLVDRLTAEGARAVVFDVLFTDPHPTKPEGDSEFARAIRSNGRVVLGAELTYTAEGSPTVIRPIDEFVDPVAAWGFVQIDADQDFMVRRHLHVFRDQDNVSSITWEAASLLGVPETKDPENRFVKRWVNYYGPHGTIPGVSFHSALETNDLCPAGFFKDKVVFVGGNIKTYFSGERKDEYINPYTAKNEFIPGVEVQTTLLLNLLRHDWLSRFPAGVEKLVVILAGILLGAGLVRFRPIIASVLAVSTAALAILLVYYLFYGHHIWFPWLAIVAVQIPASLLWSVVYNSVTSYIHNRLLEQSLSLYLSPKQVQRILKEPKLRQPGGNKQVISILFSDIAGFSRISEQLDPQELVQLLNAYYEATIRCIHQTEGTVVDIIGDAIFAIWNAPEPQPDHREKMLAAALAFHRNVTDFNGRQGKLPLHTRVGLHTGEVVVGNVGSSEHFDYTAIGENVNLASRLEGLNKQLGTDVLLTPVALPANQADYLLRPVGKFRFKGFENNVDVIELVVTPPPAGSANGWLESFAGALSKFQQQDFDGSESGFKKTLESRPNDGPSGFYLKQITEMRLHGVPEGWQGEVNLKEK